MPEGATYWVAAYAHARPERGTAAATPRPALVKAGPLASPRDESLPTRVINT